VKTLGGKEKMQTVEKKKTIRLNKAEYMRLMFLAKLKRVMARLKNKVTDRTYRFLKLYSYSIAIDRSKTEWKILYNENLEPCEMVYDSQLVATVLVCDNPLSCDLELLKAEYPEAYLACVKANGKHLRFNIKK
jgi:hypothetical protein